ncbi:hypothetical protein JXM67_06860 [candidate division WOR-3 bacterium]|nr:hypothetical protein [candidate division WOR-3 bacterium]
MVRKTDYPNLFIPQPWNIRLSQWRNIAYHHSVVIEENNIICSYGTAPNIREIRLTKEELFSVAHNILTIHQCLDLAQGLFFVDNISHIRYYLPPTDINDVRSEALFLHFASGLATQGFEILEFNRNPNEAKLIVKDLSDLDPDNRRFHASQFLFQVWLFTKSKNVIVEYHEKDNTPNLLVSTDSETCEKIYAGKLKPLDLANLQQMIDLKTNISIPPLPED